jgi:hypothetical protein
LPGSSVRDVVGPRWVTPRGRPGVAAVLSCEGPESALDACSNLEARVDADLDTTEVKNEDGDRSYVTAVPPLRPSPRCTAQTQGRPRAAREVSRHRPPLTDSGSVY